MWFKALYLKAFLKFEFKKNVIQTLKRLMVNRYFCLYSLSLFFLFVVIISNYFDLLFFCSQIVVNLKNNAMWLANYLHCSYKSSKPFLKASAFVIECALANSTSFSCSSFDSLTEILLTFGLSIFGLPIFAIPLPPINSYYTL